MNLAPGASKITDALALAFDDVLIEPAYSQILPSQTDLSTKLGPLELKIPMLSAAMDTVTESQMAIGLALLGGLGVLHKNLSAEDQAREVARVKKFQHAVITEPLTVRPDQSIQDLKRIIQETGVTGFPVVDAKGILVGMCTGRDLRFIENQNALVKDVMTSPARSLPAGASKAQILEFFRTNKVEKLPLLDAEGRLKGLMTSKDTRQAQDSPLAVRDTLGALRVGAAVGVGEVEGIARSERLVAAGCDVLVVDSAHGHSEGVLATIATLRKKHPKAIVIGGNIATLDGAKALIDAGAHIVKIGMGPGSICTTRIVSGAGMPQLTAIIDTAEWLRAKHPEIGIIADGGLRFSGDITKALVAGAHAVMMGSLLAGTDESPGDTILYNGRSYKAYRGMGSLGAMKQGSKERYFQAHEKELSKLVPEGVEARVPYKGPLKNVVFQLMGGVRSGMGYTGSATISDLYTKGKLRRITHTGLRESHVHGVSITAAPPNYSGGTDGE
jgi:IMP dehydrogenase